jgi:hypothetical protein
LRAVPVVRRRQFTGLVQGGQGGNIPMGNETVIRDTDGAMFLKTQGIIGSIPHVPRFADPSIHRLLVERRHVDLGRTNSAICFVDREWSGLRRRTLPWSRVASG